MSWTHERARVAALSRDRTPDDPELQAARQRLKAALLEDHVKKAVESYPPLTPEQLDLISAALHARTPEQADTTSAAMHPQTASGGDAA